MNLAIALVTGLGTGVLGGMLGVGGGAILIAVMVLAMGLGQRTAQGTSLVIIVALAAMGAVTHYRQGTLDIKTILWIAPLALGFSFLTGWLAGFLPDVWLSRIFGLLLLFIGGRMILAKKR